MKLELKHLSAYLPYGLKGIHTQFSFDKVIHTLESVYSYGDVLTDFDKFRMEYFKPILKPISDLEKDEFFMNLYFISNDTFEGFCVKRKNECYARLEEINYLFEQHYDIFNLIPNNLAFSIHDVV
jgi:hypothetical protein